VTEPGGSALTAALRHMVTEDTPEAPPKDSATWRFMVARPDYSKRLAACLANRSGGYCHVPKRMRARRGAMLSTLNGDLPGGST
jgi:hypothetical protein